MPGCTGQAPPIPGPVGRVPGRDEVEGGDTGGSGTTEGGAFDSKLIVEIAQIQLQRPNTMYVMTHVRVYMYCNCEFTSSSGGHSCGLDLYG